MKKHKKILPDGFFSITRESITTEESLKDVIPVDWDYILKNWDDNEESAIVLAQRDKK
ncbi:MAG: hypothetical protein ACI31V_00585 [Bacilli bacterium]